MTSVQRAGTPGPEDVTIETAELTRSTASPAQRSRVSVWLIGLFVLCFVYFFPSPVGPNEAAHLDLARAIVDHGSLSIDAYHDNTIDLALYHGHYYANKAPGQSLLAVPVYVAFKAIFHPVLPTNGETAHLAYYLLVYVEGICTVAIPAVLLLMLFFWFLGFFSTSLAHRAILTLALGLGTDVFRYADAVYSHLPATAALFGAFVLIWMQGKDHLLESRRSAWFVRHPGAAMVLAGLLLGASVVLEYPSALIAMLIGLYALGHLPRRLWPYLILGAIPGLLVIAGYDTMVYHNPLLTGYASSTSDYPGVHQTHSGSSRAYQHRFAWLLAWALLGMSVLPYRGLFFLSPFLLLAFPGYWLWARRGGREWLLFLAIPVFLFLAISVFPGWTGGMGVGPRYLITSLPFLAFPVIFVLDRATAWTTRSIIYGLIGLSIAAIWIESIGGTGYPEGNILNPLFSYSLPALLHGNLHANLVTLLVVADPSTPISPPMVTLVATFLLIALLALWSLWSWNRTTPTR